MIRLGEWVVALCDAIDLLIENLRNRLAERRTRHDEREVAERVRSSWERGLW